MICKVVEISKIEDRDVQVLYGKDKVSVKSNSWKKSRTAPKNQSSYSYPNTENKEKSGNNYWEATRWVWGRVVEGPLGIPISHPWMPRCTQGSSPSTLQLKHNLGGTGDSSGDCVPACCLEDLHGVLDFWLWLITSGYRYFNSEQEDGGRFSIILSSSTFQIKNKHTYVFLK